MVALGLLALLNREWGMALSVAYVMGCQALSGIAKDLTKMSAKSAVKVLVPKGDESGLFKWVALLTGSKTVQRRRILARLLFVARFRAPRRDGERVAIVLIFVLGAYHLDRSCE